MTTTPFTPATAPCLWWGLMSPTGRIMAYKARRVRESTETALEAFYPNDKHRDFEKKRGVRITPLTEAQRREYDAHWRELPREAA